MRKAIIQSPFIFKQWLRKCKPVLSLDTETTDLNHLRLEITGFSLSDGEQACYVDLDGNEHKDKLLALLGFFLEEQAELVIMHNSPFDMAVLFKYGIKI